MSVLVTGAQGFIGSALAERLLDAGERVVALRRDADPESRFVADGIEERCVLALADLADYESLLRVLDENGVSTVFHLGAQATVGTANQSPLSTFEANVRGTYTLLEACRALGGSVERIVVASSDKAYGAHDEHPYREDFALAGALPVRRVEGVLRPDRPLLRGDLPATGSGHALRERVRAGRRATGHASSRTRHVHSCGASAR